MLYALKWSQLYLFKTTMDGLVFYAKARAFKTKAKAKAKAKAKD